MRVSLTTTDGCWASEEVPNEGDGMIWAAGELSRDGNEEYKEEGEFDRYEPQSPGTPASSPCPASPTSPTFSRSLTLPDCCPQGSIFSTSPFLTPTLVPSSASMQYSLSTNTTEESHQALKSTKKPKPKPTIFNLPPELLRQIFIYALDEDWIYDYLEELDEYSENWPKDSRVRGAIVPGERGGIGFRRLRVEIQLSQVCKWWREIMDNHVDLWELAKSFNKCIHITGQQWFHPSFPFYILEGDSGYKYVNISFSGFNLPPEFFRPSSTLFDFPLFDAPAGSNYHDDVPPPRRIHLDSTNYIRLKLSNHSNVAINKVLENIDFPLTSALKIITTVNSESRFYVSERYHPGLRLPMTGGISHFDDGTPGPGEPENGISLGFEINSWLRDWGSEVGARIGDFSRWFCPASDVYERHGLHVKLPKMEATKKEWRVPRVGWRDKIAQIFSSSPNLSVWDQWDNTVCGQGRLCEHQYDYARLEGFVDSVQQLEFSLLRLNEEDGVSLPVGSTWRENMVLMVHPLQGQFHPYDEMNGWEIYNGVSNFAVGVKGYDVSGQAVVRAEGCGCDSMDHWMLDPKGHTPRCFYC